MDLYPGSLNVIDPAPPNLHRDLDACVPPPVGDNASVAKRFNVTDVDSYDILVVGSGESGKYLAWTMAGTGYRTAVIEQKLIGGSCPNIACLPSKNIIHSAKVKSLAARASAFGVTSGSIRTDMKAVQQRKRTMVESLIRIHVDRYEPRVWT